MTDETTRRLCIEPLDCALCQFPLENGKHVLAAAGTENGHVYAEFTLRQGRLSGSGEAGVDVHICRGDFCDLGCPKAPCFHHGCYHLGLSVVTPERLAATKYYGRPPASEISRRRRHIKCALTPRLESGVLNGLPEDICYEVAGLLVRESAIVSSQELYAASASESETSHNVDLSRDIYAQFIKIEGVRYLKSLSNEPCTGAKGNVRVFQSGRGRVVRSIYLRHDHLGARGVWFSLPDDELSRYLEARGVWWTRLSHEDGLQRVTAKTDGLKVRQLTCSTPHGGPAESHPAWPVPELNCTLIDLQRFQPARGKVSHLRMNAMGLNEPGIEGYCAAFSGQALSGLFAHYSGTTSALSQELDRADHRTLWLYIPVDRGEHIREIWAVRHMEAHAFDYMSLMFVTNLERTVLFGPWRPALKPRLLRVLTADNQPSRIYFDEKDPDEGRAFIKYLGVRAAETVPSVYQSEDEKDYQHQYPDTLIPAQGKPTGFLQCYYTQCRLEDVSEITCCVDRGSERRPIIGILLRYGGGRRACLGQYRPGWADAPLQVRQESALWVGKRHPEQPPTKPYIAEVRLEAPSCPGSLRWMEIPWRGRLEWWFYTTCELRHYE